MKSEHHISISFDALNHSLLSMDEYFNKHPNLSKDNRERMNKAYVEVEQKLNLNKNARAGSLINLSEDTGRAISFTLFPFRDMDDHSTQSSFAKIYRNIQKQLGDIETQKDNSEPVPS